MASTLTFAVPVEWSSSTAYEINTIVFVGKKAYTAIQDVPAGIAITNASYWSETGVTSQDLSEVQSRLNSLDSLTSTHTTQISTVNTRSSTNANNIATLTNDLATATSNLNAAITKLNNIMISLYTPPES